MGLIVLSFVERSSISEGPLSEVPLHTTNLLREVVHSSECTLHSISTYVFGDKCSCHQTFSSDFNNPPASQKVSWSGSEGGVRGREGGGGGGGGGGVGVEVTERIAHYFGPLV